MGRIISSITVADALRLPELRRGLPEILAGSDSLDRAIRWVHAGEVPNIATLLRGGELLLTTGMGIDGSATGQRRFVHDLDERGIAGLVVELGERFESSLPRAMVETATECDLPLVELHAEVPFVAVTEAVHTALVNDHYDQLRRADELQDRFTEVMLREGGVTGVLTLLAEAVGNPVFLESGDGRLLAYAVPGDEELEDSVAAWRGAREQADELGLATVVLGDGTQGGGRLVALPMAAPLSGFAALALRRAAGIIALALMRSRQEEELRVFGSGELLAGLAGGRLDPAAARTRAREAGFDPTRRSSFVPFAARLVGADIGAVWTPFIPALERELAALGDPSLVGLDSDAGELLIVVGARVGVREELADRIAALIRKVADDGGPVRPIVVAGPQRGWQDLAAALREAKETTEPASRLEPRAWFDSEALGLDRLLWAMRDSEALRRFATETLAPVADHDARRRHLLMPTLEMLCAVGGRKAEAARLLHVNRQALYERIDRLQQLLPVDLADPATLSVLAMAIRARAYVAGH